MKSTKAQRTCPYCHAGPFTRKNNLNRHLREACPANPARPRRETEKRRPVTPIGARRRPLSEEPESAPEQPVKPIVVETDKTPVVTTILGSEGLTDAYIKSLPTSEAELEREQQQKKETELSQAERERQFKVEQLRVRVSEKLNKFVAKLTVQPLGELAAKVAVSRGQPALTPIEREYISDALDVLTSLVGLEFDVQPWILVVHNIFAAMGFALLIPAVVVFLRPGMSAEQKKTWREKLKAKKAEEKK